MKQAAVIGISAGSPAAVAFALKYPERCWGMILVSSITRPMGSLKRETDLVYHWMQRSDFLAWVLNGLGFRAVQVLNGGDADAWQAVRHNHMSSTILYAYLATSPIRLRRRGMHNDQGQVQHLRTLPLEAVTTPTMVLHGDIDPVVPAAQARSAAERIPDAKYLEIHGGGHLVALTHRDVAAPEMVAFLNAHAPRG
ncbi:MAG: alpha/beta hydrolase [Anaerolineaceae bacterium]